MPSQRGHALNDKEGNFQKILYFRSKRESDVLLAQNDTLVVFDRCVLEYCT